MPVKKDTKEYFYEIRPVEDGERCINCEFPILTSGLFYAVGAPGPFCRPECIAKYHGIKGKIVRKKESFIAP